MQVSLGTTDRKSSGTPRRLDHLVAVAPSSCMLSQSTFRLPRKRKHISGTCLHQPCQDTYCNAIGPLSMLQRVSDDGVSLRKINFACCLYCVKSGPCGSSTLCASGRESETRAICVDRTIFWSALVRQARNAHTHKQSFLFGRSLTCPAFHLACPLLPPLVSLPNHMAFGSDTARGAARRGAASPLPPNSTCREAHQPVVTHCPLRAPTQAYSPTISSTYCAKPYR